MLYTSYVCLLSLASCFLSPETTSTSNETQEHYCMAHHLQQKEWEDPVKWQRHIEFEKALHESYEIGNSDDLANYTLPIVVHIIHQNGSENISDLQVIDAIDHLNGAFANEGYYDQGTGLNTDIEFCLAARTPDGAATNGINRVESPLTNMLMESQDLELKNLSRWNPEKYINVWIVNDICSVSGECGIAGYAYFPTSHGLLEDGIVVEANYTGSSPANSTVLIHEMGHYLGLYHTFQGGCPNDDCSQSGDRVCDTPPDQSTSNMPCNENSNSCSTDTDSGFSTDQNDMFWNYMDYSDVDCYSAFTEGQATRMIFSIENPRASLIDSDGCYGPCTEDISVDIQINPTEVIFGQTVSFTKSNMNATNFEWFLDGNSMATGNIWTTSFTELGLHQIKIKATNNNPDCIAFDYLVIEVVCSAQANFTQNETIISIGEVIDFTNNTTNADSYKWFFNDELVSETADLSYEFNIEGFYEVILVAQNSECPDTSDVGYVVVQNPCTGTGISQVLIPEVKTAIRPRPTADGGFLFAGRHDENNLNIFGKMGEDKSIEWVKRLNLQNSDMPEIIEDPANNGYIIGGISTGPGDDFAFILKIDTAGNLVWARQLSQGFALTANDLDKTTDGHFIFGYTVDGVVDVIKISSDGEVSWFNRYLNIRATEIKVAPDNSFYITLCTDAFSPFINHVGAVKCDIDGNVEWSRYYHYPNQFDGSSSILCHSPSIFNAAGGLNFMIFSTPEGSPVDIPYRMPILISTSSSGEILWSKQYNLNANAHQNELDGYTLTSDGNALFMTLNSQTGDFNLTKIDANGNILSSYGYEQSLSSQNSNLITLANGQLATMAIRTGSVALTIYLDEDGIAGDCFPKAGLEWIVEDNGLVSSPLSIEQTVNTDISNLTATVSELPATSLPICGSPPPQDAEVVTQILDIDICNSMMHVAVEFCNEGYGDLPANTPIAIYDNDPTQSNAALLTTSSIDVILPAGACHEILLEFAITTDQIFIVANDDGSLSTAYDFDDFPITDIVECNYHNNLDSITATNSSNIILNLGNDTTVCENQPILLQTNVVFAEYEWSNGATTPSIMTLESGIYQVTVTDLCGNTQTDELFINTLKTPSVDLNPQTLCDDDIANLDAGVGFASYLWQDGFNEQIYSAWLPGTYSVTVTDMCGETATDAVEIIQAPYADLVMPDDVTIELGDEYAINPTVSSTVPLALYQWEPSNEVSCADCLGTQVMPLESTWFTLTITTEDGCSTTDSIYIFVDDNVGIQEIYGYQEGIVAPNVFSPNNDGENDYFTIFGKDIQRIKSLQIFSRRGDMVFEKRDFAPNVEEEGWDGTMNGNFLNKGVFVFKIEILLKNGAQKTSYGDVFLMR